MDEISLSPEIAALLNGVEPDRRFRLLQDTTYTEGNVADLLQRTVIWGQPVGQVWKSEIDALGTRQTKHIKVLEADQYDPGFPPSRLVDFQAWFDNVLSQIPEEFRDTAEIEFSSTSSYYDSHYGSVEVTYRRPETDDEWEARKRDVTARKAAQDAAREAEERRAYEALKAKFERPAT